MINAETYLNHTKTISVDILQHFGVDILGKTGKIIILREISQSFYAKFIKILY